VGVQCASPISMGTLTSELKQVGQLTKEKKMDVSIEKIIIKIGKKEIALTKEEVNKLHSALDDLFGKETIVKHEYSHSPWYYTRPRYRDPYERWYIGDTICSSNQMTGLSSNGMFSTNASNTLKLDLNDPKWETSGFGDK